MTLVTFIATESALVVFILQMVQAWYILLNACSICTMTIPSTTMKIALSYICILYVYIYVYRYI